MFIDDRHSSGRSLTRWVSLVLGVLVLVVAVVGLLLWWYAGSRLDPMEVGALAEDTDQETAADATNILVVGTDGPPGRDASEGGAVAETILLVQLSEDRARPMAVALPTALRLPPSDDGAVRLGDVFTESGTDALVRSLQDFTGIDVDHYVGIDLGGASRLAEAVDGVEVCPDDAVQDEATGLDLSAGCQQVRGDQAEAWVRSGADAFQQVRRSMQFVGDATGRVALTDMVNPLSTKRLVDAVRATVVTDRDLGLTSLYGVAEALAGLEPEDVDLRTVPGTIQTIDGERYVVAAPEQAPGMFDALATGRELDADAGTEAATELGPADVDVLIVNGVGINGLAGDVQSYLEERGFPVVDAVNPRDLDPEAGFDTALERLTIRHTPGTLPHAQVLRDHLGDVPLDVEEVTDEELPQGADVVLEVGAAWNDR